MEWGDSPFPQLGHLVGGADPVRLHRGGESGDNRLIDGKVPPRGAEKPGEGVIWGQKGRSSLRE